MYICVCVCASKEDPNLNQIAWFLIQIICSILDIEI